MTAHCRDFANLQSKSYRLERRTIGATNDGRPIEIVPMAPDAAHSLGEAFATIGPWKHYGFTAGQLAASFVDASGGNHPFELIVDGTLAGAIIVRDPFLIGPYLVFLGVLPDFQGKMIGDAALGWFEAEARRGNNRNIWLCVTGINERAQWFYRRHGWEIATTLPGLIRDGDDEIMMRKRLS